MLHDTHAHLEMLLEKLDILTLADKDDFNPLYEYAFARQALDSLLQNHEFIIQATTSTKNFLLTRKLFGYNPKVKFIIGSHPEIVDNHFIVNDYLNQQKELLLEHGLLQNTPTGGLELITGVNPQDSEPTDSAGDKHNLESDDFEQTQIVGLGECGLDYHYTEDQEVIGKQWVLFESQLSLAAYLNLPLIVHMRDSFADTIAIVQKFPQMHSRLLFHCFSQDLSELEEVLGLGGYISIGGVLTFKNAEKLRQVIQACPLDRLLIETDLPFLSPTPHRGKVCLPAYIDHVAQEIATLKNLTTAEVWDKLKKNSLQFSKKFCISF